MRDTYDCEGYKWVFNYAHNSDDKNIIIGKEDIYRCKEVVEAALNKVDDYALIRLDRSVIKQKPLKYRQEGSISFDEKVFLIGNPTGMPLKIADSGYVVAKSESRFVTNLDSFEGNSGSAVFNSKTNLIEGILVSGEKDYEYDKSQKCYYTNVLDEQYGRESVTKITRVKSLYKKE
jgi:V8-like Glu-specific endopeptidase